MENRKKGEKDLSKLFNEYILQKVNNRLKLQLRSKNINNGLF